MTALWWLFLSKSRFDIEKAFEFMEINYDKNISLEDMSKVVKMTGVGFKMNCENLHGQPQQHPIGACLSAFNRHSPHHH